MSFLAPKAAPMMTSLAASKGLIAGEAAPTSLAGTPPPAPVAPALLPTGPAASSRPSGTNKRTADAAVANQTARQNRVNPTYGVGSTTPPSYGRNSLMGQV